jgi:hypothetical protein
MAYVSLLSAGAPYAVLRSGAAMLSNPTVRRVLMGDPTAVKALIAKLRTTSRVGAAVGAANNKSEGE